MQIGLVVWLTLALALVLLAPAPVSAQAPPLFWQSPSDGVLGGEAGQMFLPSGIGVEPDTPGNLFVADLGNSRIDELDVWGQFKRTWGWEVVKEGPDDKPAVNGQQRLTVSATSGAYKLKYFDAYRGNFEEFTAPIPFSASAVEVEAALVGLASIAPNDVTVSGGPGDAGGSSPYAIEFTGVYANTAIPQLSVESSTLSGGSGAGVQTLREGGSFEVCVPADGDVCRQGQGGGYGPGGFGRKSPSGVAVDGGVYVFENGENKSFRVQKFDNEGHFLLMWGGEVDKTTHADRCTKDDVEGGDVCGAGVPGSAPGRFESEGLGVIAVGPEGDIFVGDKERIQKFDPEGHYLGEVALPGKSVWALAIDSAGNYYVTYVGDVVVPGGSKVGFDVHKLSASGVELAKFTAYNPQSVAVGGTGRVYTVENPLSGLPRILGFEQGGTCFICAGEELRATPQTDPIGLASSSACGIVGEDLYASFAGGGSSEGFVRAYGPQPDPTIPGCEPPVVAPGIDDQYASSVSTDGAVLRAVINPHFWSGPVLGPTTYYLQYATAACVEAGGWGAGCVKEQPAPPGRTLEAGAVDAEIASAPFSLSGLQPATAYRYRFVAQSPAGGPVFGRGATPGHDGAEGRFATFALPPGSQGGCENEAFRGGSAAFLPDCRAYEVVSPADKENGDIFALMDANGDHFALNQSSTDGEAFTYSSFRAFGEARSAPISSQYLARRGEAGWSNEAINPPRGSAFLGITSTLTNEFKAFTPDLCEAWVFHEDGSPTLGAGAVAGFVNLYRRRDCGAEAGSFTALTTIEPVDRLRDGYIPELLGVSANGSRAIFRVDDALPGTGAPVEDLGAEHYDLYEAYGEGQVRFVCRLSSGTPVRAGCAAGTGTHVVSLGRQEAVSNAISNDGSKIFWSDAPDRPGRLYVRIDGKKTVRLSSVPAQYWTAAADGSAALFTTGESPPETHLQALAKGEGVLHRYDVGKEEDGVIAEKVYGVMGASQDAERVYFASGEVLDNGALEGRPNLYLWQGGETPTYKFIGTLGGADVGVAEHVPSPLQTEPDRHVAQVTPDGSAAVFMSTASLTGQDNTDLGSGEPDAEVFHYDAASGRLSCASCNPTGARPTGREVFGNWAASRIPGAQTQVYQVPRVLSADGGRIFFESFQPLVANDTDGVADVYEWERPGDGTCTTLAPIYSPAAGGCVSLISSGKSTADSTIADVSPSGRDVFFATASRLLPKSDPDELYDVYDARVGGGFPSPAEPPAPCEGEACQGSPLPPGDATPASFVFSGPGDLLPLLSSDIAPKKTNIARARAQELSRALKACRKLAKSKRKRCQAAARRRYATRGKGSAKPRSRKSNRGSGRS